MAYGGFFLVALLHVALVCSEIPGSAAASDAGVCTVQRSRYVSVTKTRSVTVYYKSSTLCGDIWNWFSCDVTKSRQGTEQYTTSELTYYTGYECCPGYQQVTSSPLTCEQFVLGDTIPYFQLESFDGVRELEREQDANSEPILIPRGMIVGDLVASTVFVSENGVFSFGKPWKFSHPEVFPTGNYYIQQRDVVAPFWSDNDICKEGKIRYLTMYKGDSTVGDELMHVVLEYLKTREDINISSSYAPTWMIVGQWDKVHPFPHGLDNNQGVAEEFLDLTNIYQGIILTDNTDSYYFFTYPCGEVNWSTIGEESAVVGVNAHGDGFSNHPASGYPNIGDAVSCTSSDGSKRASHDLFGIHAGTVPLSKVNPRLQLCALFVRASADLTLDVLLKDVLPNVEHCPPTLQQADEDVMFHQDPTQNNENCRLQVVPFEFSTTSNSYSFVQQCCYDASSNGAIYKNLPEAGTLIAYDPVSQKEKYEEFERPFREQCCLAYDDCGRFSYYRPSNDGTEYQPPETARGTGDPHFLSLDGKYFDFQGLGDFVELELLSGDGSVIFQIQARLYQYYLWRRNTLHLAIALGEPGNIGYEIFAKENKLVVHQTPENKLINIMSDFTAADESSTYWFKRHSSTSLTALHKSGISVRAEWRRNLFMNVYLTVPGSLRESRRVRGIFGNYDGNANNEFVRRDNPDVPVTAANNNERLLYEIYLTWAVKEEESLFRTPRSTSRRKRDDFQPIFFDELEFNDGQRAFCKDDEHCLYDLVVTQEEDVAMTTLEAVEEVDRIEAVLENFPPSLVGDATFPVTIGEEGIYSFTVEDEGDDFTVTVAGGPPVGSSLEDNGAGRYSFRWLPQNADNVSVTFLAVDTAGAAAALTPQVRFCGCVNGGMCTLDGIFNLDTAATVVANCICLEAYSGRFCEEDTNGCSEIDCFEGVECFDVPAPGMGAKCGTCPLGYTGDGEKCIDIDECSLDSSLCDHSCTNTVGSYDCVCNEGYELVFGTGECRDINECAGVNDCQQICSNTEGSFECNCNDGFTLDSDQRTCIADVLCEGGVGNCSHECVVVDGEEKCFCPVGMELSPVNSSACVDINECARFSPCHQVCTDTPGSFECSCRDGFELQDDFTCQDIDECLIAGMNGENLCQESKTRCENTPGSFQCICAPGHVKSDGECLRVMDAPPPPVMQSLPQSGVENSHKYTLVALTINELTPDIFQKFRTVTAQAVNRFCDHVACIVNEQNVTGLQVLPENVAIPLTSIMTNSAGSPVLSFYVQITESAFLSVESLQLAVKSAEDLYNAANLLAKFPALHLMFTQDSPIVSGKSVTAYIESSEPTTKIMCRISGYSDVDCSSGVVQYSNLPFRDGNRAYTLRVEGTTKDGRKHVIRRKLRIEQPGYCAVHLINNGVTVHDGIVTIEFAPTGSTVSTACILNPPKTDNNGLLSCTSPATLIPGPGSYVLKVIPHGCDYRKRSPIKVEFEVPEE